MADAKLHVKPHSFEIGQNVLLKLKIKDNKDPIFDPNPFKIVKIHGRMITISRNKVEYTRNSSELQIFNTQKEQKIVQCKKSAALNVRKNFTDLFNLGCPEKNLPLLKKSSKMLPKTKI